MTECIGYLGPKGTFSEQAVKYFVENTSKEYILKDFSTIAHILWAVENEEVQLGIVPVENSIEGSVNITLDMLAQEVNLFIQGEIIINIKHSFMCKTNDLSKINIIYSHPLALAQCRKFLYREFPNAKYIATNSTAEAAFFAKNGEDNIAAIGSSWAADEYKLDIKYSNVSDYEANQTRFLIIGKQLKESQEAIKTSLCIVMNENKPGGLYEILGEFVKFNIDLTRIESRPLKKELGNYMFFIECFANLLDEKNKSVLEGLKRKCKKVKILGIF